MLVYQRVYEPCFGTKFYAQKVQVSLEKNVLAFPRWRMASRLVLAWATPWPLATIWRSPKVRCVWLVWLKNLGKTNWVNKTLKIFASLINKKSPVEKGRNETSQCFFLVFCFSSWAMKDLQLASSTKTPLTRAAAKKRAKVIENKLRWKWTIEFLGLMLRK